MKGRGAQSNPSHRFSELIIVPDEYTQTAQEPVKIKTKYRIVKAKTIINKVDSPDIQFDYSINPYQGCEHGCIYCYARITHNYWGYSSGLDFESIIHIKSNAASLLERKLQSKSWKVSPIMLSGNTDCYQPLERKFQITRQLLQCFWKYRHPVGIITKNKLLLRDLDILTKLNQHNLVKVAVSINTLDEDVRQKLEPRASTIQNRLDLISALTNAKIPVIVMAAPIIPGLNDHEIINMVKEFASRGACDVKHIILRLNGDIAKLFGEWTEKYYPDRAQKILNAVASCHGGSVSDSRFGKRMSGEGKVADIIKKQFHLAKNKYINQSSQSDFNLRLHSIYKNRQLDLFKMI